MMTNDQETVKNKEHSLNTKTLKRKQNALAVWLAFQDAQLVDLTSYRLFHDSCAPGQLQQLLAAGHQPFRSLLSLQSEEFDSSIFLSDRYRLLEVSHFPGVIHELVNAQ